MSRRRSLVLLMVLLTATMVGCRSARPSCKPGASDEIAKLIEGKPFDVKLLEFDDYGVECHEKQLAQILHTIKQNNEQAGEAGALTIVYVHGWHHGATTPNLHYFINDLLEPLAQQEEIRNPGHARPMLGIYVAWRGERWKGVVDNWPASYYDRSDTAVRIGTTGALESLPAIMAAANRNAASRSILIGHSMGGLIVERAFTTAMRAYISREADRQKSFEWNPPADLIITINPAAPALEAWRFNRTLDEWNVHLPPRATQFTHGDARPWRPLIASLVSEADWATSSVMSLASGLRYFSTDTGATGANRPLTPAEEKQLLRYASGFSCELLTHVVQEDGNVTPGKYPVAPCMEDHLQNTSPGSLGWKVKFGSVCATPPVHKAGDPRACMEVAPDRFRLLEMRKAAGDGGSGDDRNLYWIMRVPANVMGGHVDFFNRRSLNLIRALISLTGALASNRHEPASGIETVAAREIRETMFGVQERVTASAGPPGLCVIPDDVTFTFDSTGCNGAGGDDRLIVCPGPAEFTFRVQPASVATQTCANFEWQIEGVRYKGPTVRHTLTKETAVVLRLTSDRLPLEKKAFIAFPKQPAVISATPQVSVDPRIHVSYRGEASGCPGTGRPCIAGERILFEGSVARSDGPVLLSWDFGGGRVYGSKTDHRFGEARPHIVTAIAEWADRTVVATTEVHVVGCTDPPPPLVIRYRGEQTGCTESAGACASDEPIVFRVASGYTPCGTITWDDGSTRAELTRPLGKPSVTVSATLTTHAGASSASMTVRASSPPDPTVVTKTEVVTTVVRCTFDQGLSKSYTVRAGDWLSTIALDHYQSLDWSRIYDSSRRSLRSRHPDRIYPGDQLTIPLCDPPKR